MGGEGDETWSAAGRVSGAATGKVSQVLDESVDGLGGGLGV